MGIVRKQSFYSSIFVYVSMFIGYINLIVLMPIFFSLEEQGMTRSILTFAVAFAGFSELGTSSIIYRFFPIYKKNEAKDFLNIITFIPLVGFALFLGVALIFQDSLFKSYFDASPELKKYISLIFYLTFFTMATSIGTSYCIVYLKTVFPRAVNELIPKLGNTILILLYAKKLIDFDQYFFYFCTLTTITAIVIWIYIGRIGALRMGRNFSSLSKRLSKSLLKFGGIAIMGTSFATILNYIDVLMLGGMRGQADVATFSIGYYVLTIMSVPFIAIISVVTPLLSTAIRNKNWDEVLKYYKQTSLNNFIIGGFIFVMLVLVFPDILNVLPSGKGYENAFYIVLYLGIGRLLDMITGCNAEIILLSKYFMFNFYSIVVVSILKVIINYLLIMQFGMEGIAISGLITLFLFNGSRYLYIYYKMGIQPFTSKTLLAGLIILIASAISWNILDFVNIELAGHKFYSALLNIMLKSGIWTLIFIPTILFFNVSKELNSFFDLIWRRIYIWQKN